MPPDRLVRPAISPGIPTQATAHPEVRDKPRLRGVLHQYAFFVSLASGTLLVLLAATTRAAVAAAIYAASVSALFGVSALYHRVTWTPLARRRMRRLDHAMIFLLIAGTYTPFGLLVMSSGWAVPMLSLAWSGALAAILLKLFWVRAPKLLSAALALALGWLGAVAFSQLLKLQLPGVLLVVAGGLLYTLGALVYARRRPDPLPHLFGYHELFHVLTVAAVACQYASIAFFVLPSN